MDQKIKTILEKINDTIRQVHYGDSPQELYDPITYIMSLGGKRMRPLLVVLGYQLFKSDWTAILKPAIAVEVFHNFTLMHDDIMDKAPLRRGQATVHEKWNDNTAILSGDVMLVNAYQLLLDVAPTKLPLVIARFNRCAAEVCEGQQWDMNFETRAQVTEAEYLHMIRLKTAVLLGFSLELGALLADAPLEEAQSLKKFGDYVGIGFQLKDDLLDVYGDQTKFGKQVGGDIIANKKTYLLIEALSRANETQAAQLHRWLSATSFDKVEKVKAVKDIYDELNIKSITEEKISTYFNQAFSLLSSLHVDESAKDTLQNFLQYLINRET
ncbi:MAG: polyprenyl synthetase family protein [Thermonemataceae bacterium]